MVSESEIERRLPVWHALSDVFLDTELQPCDYKWIAGVLKGSGYSPAELRAILQDEVAPAFITNLLSVAGEWTSWSEDEVRHIMLRSLRRRVPMLKWMRKRLARRVVGDEWQRIASAMAE